jgi:ribosome-binding factor A
MATRRPFKRTDRLNRELLRALSVSMKTETREALLHEVTVMDVEVTRDLSLARVYLYAPEEKHEEVREALGRAQGFLRSSVAKKIRMRHAPELRFSFDVSLDRAQRIESILSDMDIPAPADEEPS